MNKRTIVLGASPNSERYSYKATLALKNKGHEVFPIGIKSGEIENNVILTEKPLLPNIDTITLYLGKSNQAMWYDYIFQIHPKRLIFNPGAENEELKKLAEEKGITCTDACTLVLLSVGNY